MSREPFGAPGPFRASQLRDGDPYELSDGHAIRCVPAGGRHGVAHIVGGRVLSTDPAATHSTGVDVGIEFNDGKNLRAPDIVVGGVEPIPGWQKTFPPLAVEYADNGQDEPELQQKIGELLAGGTQFVWVVRLAGPLRVEVHAAGKPMRIYGADDELTAPGILRNPVPVRALVDPDAANVAALRNLLTQYGYKSIDEIRTEGRAEGRIEGRAEGLAEGANRMVSALLEVLATRGLIPDDAQVEQIRRCRDLATLQQWLVRAAVTDTLAGVLD